MNARRVVLCLVAGALALSAAAQETSSGCSTTSYANPPRQVVACVDVTVEAEADAQFKLIDGDRDGRPEGVELNGRAVLIEITPGRLRSFKVQTPHAIASVRGTVYVVDVEAEKTAVFVARGLVGVSKPRGRETVTLEPGQGVDVEAGAPLEVKTWGQGRAAALLGRFAR